MTFLRRAVIDIKNCLAIRFHGAVAELAFRKSFPQLANTVRFPYVPPGRFSKKLKRPKTQLNIFRALKFRLDAIEDALKVSQKDKDARFLLYLFLDEHLQLLEAFQIGDLDNLRGRFPKAELAISALNAFDVSKEVRCTRFWSNAKPSKVLDLKALFSKTLPNRSSARNLQPIFQKFFAKNANLFEQIFKIALLGNYRFSPHKLDFELRNAVYRLTADECLKVINTNVQLAILSVKLFLINEVRSLPSLRAVLMKRQWQNVESSCIPILKLSARSLEELLGSAAKHKAKVCKFSPPDAAFKAVTKKINSSLASRRTCEDFNLFYRLSTRVQASEIPFFLLNAFGVPNQTILSLESIARGATTSLRCNEESSQVIATFLEAFDVRFHVKVFDLPKHVADAQRNAIVKRFGLKEETSDEEIESYAPGFIFCARCRTFKGYLNNISEKRKKVRGYGSANVLITENGLCCACSKSTKVVAAKPRGLIANLRQPKKKKRVSRTHFCQFTQLLRFDSFARVVQFYGEQYLLCPLCACFAKYRDMRWRAGSLNCEICFCRKKD
jgi:hypothetical protein